MYIYQKKGWPDFTWSEEKLFQLLAIVSHRQGRLIGKMEGLGFSLQEEAMLQTMTLEIIKSNEIEGEILNSDQVRSSIARRLGMDIAGLIPSDRNVDGVVEMMLDATQNFKQPLTDDRLFGWHSSLFPSGRSGMYKILAGNWRNNAENDPMQVVSGGMGREKVHFQAPGSELLPAEMQRFLEWFNSADDINPILKAAIAHLWFVTLHPFDDGNGRIARTIADMQLTRADGVPQRFYSMSAQIRLERKQYYDVLEQIQKGSLDITGWLEWFLNCLDRGLIAAEDVLSGVIHKSRYWEWLRGKKLNERQRKIINNLLDGFEGKLTSGKWAKITKTSQDTALRDIQDLLGQEVLVREESGGRSTRYKINNIK